MKGSGAYSADTSLNFSSFVHPFHVQEVSSYGLADRPEDLQLIRPFQHRGELQRVLAETAY